MGATAEKIEKAVTDTPLYKTSGLKILHASSMQEAIETARKEASPGDIISLSPACASFDMYPNFEARGKDFKARVNALK